MKTSTPPRTARCLIACCAAFGLAALAPAALDDSIWEGISYYSTFEDSEAGLTSERGSGTWKTSGSPAFTVYGTHRVMTGGTGHTGNQGVLASTDTAFTIAFQGRVGTTDNGLLFAFGTSGGAEATGTGGLSFRRDTTFGSLAVCVGRNEERIVTSCGSDTFFHVYVLTYDAADTEAPLKLYVDGAPEPVGTAQVGGTLIAPQFQWGTRHANPCPGETAASGHGIDALGVWKRVLNADEIAALAAEWEPWPVVTQKEATFTAVPEGWSIVPTQVPAWEMYQSSVSLEVEPVARQTLGGRAVNVSEITGSMAENASIYGISSSSYGDKSAVNRDVWLKVSGGSFDIVVGGKDNDWKGSHANAINGNLLTEVTGQGTRARNVLGGIYGCSDGSPGDEALPLTGDTLVTIANGAKVTGNIVGGSFSIHAQVLKHTGNATVRIYALQDETDENHPLKNFPAGHVTGAGAFGSANNGDTSGETITGTSTVEVVLGEGAGTFAKEIYGAAYTSGTGAFTVGASAVTIDAPGVTFPHIICAGGHGDNVSVTNAATLTLRGGIFSGELTPTADNSSVGSSVLVIDGGEAGIDLSRATVGAFGAVTLKSDLALGGNRLANATIAVDGDAARTLTLTLTEAELAAGVATLAKGEAIPEGLTVVAANAPEAWSLKVRGGSLVYAAGALEWVTPADGSTAWADGLEGFAANRDVRFGANGAQETVTTPAEGVVTGAMTVEGNYRLAGLGAVEADSVEVAAGGTLTLDPTPIRARQVYLMPESRVASGDGWALSEIELTLDGEPISLEGASIAATVTEDKVATPVGEQPANLIDGRLDTAWVWETSVTASQQLTITLTAPEGTFFTFDGYRVATADQPGRNIRAWSLVVNGGDYNALTFADDKQYSEEVASAWTPSAWTSEEPYALRYVIGTKQLTVRNGMTVAGTLSGQGMIAGDIAFAAGSTLAYVPGTHLTVAGQVSGTVTLDLSADADTAWRTAGATAVLYAPGATDPAALTFTLGEGLEGWTVRYSNANRAYWLVRDYAMPFKAEIAESVAWSALAWRDAEGAEVPLAAWNAYGLGEIEAELSPTLDYTVLTFDLPSVTPYLKNVTIANTGHILALGTADGVVFAPEQVVVEGRLSTLLPKFAPKAVVIDGSLAYSLTGDTQTFDLADLPPATGSGRLTLGAVGKTFQVTAGTSLGATLNVSGGTLDFVAEDYSQATLPTAIGVTHDYAGLHVAEGVTVPATVNATLSAGAVFSGGGTFAGTLTVDGSPSESGTLAATIDGSDGAPHVGAIVLRNAALVRLSVPADAAPGAPVLTWDTAPAGLGTFLPSGNVPLVQREDGFYTMIIPAAADGDESGTTFSDSAMQWLSAAATQNGLSEVVSVTGLANGRPMTTAEINDALDCFYGTGLIVADAEAKALRVVYDFTVTAIALGEAGEVSVTATLAGTETDAMNVAIFGNVTVALVPVTLTEEGAVEGEPVATREVAYLDGLSAVTLTAPAAQAGEATRLFKVRVTPVRKAR